MDFRQRFENQLESKLLTLIEANGFCHSYPKGHIILACNQRIDKTYFLLSGAVKVIRPEGDRNLLLYYIDSTEDCVLLFGRHLFPSVSEVSVQVEEDVRLLSLPVEMARKWLMQYPDWMRFVLQSESRHFEKILSRLDHLAFQNLDQRLLSYLNERAQLSQSSVINQSHEGIADDLTTSRTVISRLLKKMENENKLRLYRNRIQLLDEGRQPDS
ncbi:MAG: Crp/Fnr family transcriptional regulator [Sphingobacteriales bacterium]|nr:MAG: Crp/Fnr family transcriptional regulator [Sphingobacteriales bacterium]